MDKSPFLGLRTVIYAAPELADTKAWYTDAFGTEPYFDEPFYVGFNIGGYELGLDPNASVSEGSTVTYWGVTNIAACWERMLRLGATVHAVIQEVGDGIRTAAVKDPFGNVVGLIENPHFSV